jgi:hypothetical protein
MGVTFRATGRQIALNNRVMPVVFGHYAWLKEWQGENIKKAGSGLFVAPGIGLCARHVSRGFHKLDDRIEAVQRRMGPLSDRYALRPAVTQYAGLLYQTSKVHVPGEKDAPFWGVLVQWPSPDTDITVLQAEPTTLAAEMAFEGMSFIDWQLLPPERGSRVDVFGFPNAKINVGGGIHNVDITLQSETVHVVDVFGVIQTHGFTEFPGFQVHRELAHGFSGGPVFYKDRLVGIFSGPDYVSALWPLLLHEYPCREDNLDVDLRDPGAIRKPMVYRRFSDLLAVGTIRADDLADVEGRVRRMPCEEALVNSNVETRCDKDHVVLER